MDQITKSDLRGLVSHTNGSCVTLFAPMVVAGRETRQNAIQFKNLVRSAEERLVGRGLRNEEAEALLAPATALLPDEAFWQHQQRGLVMFLARDFSRRYAIDAALEPAAIVARHFHVKPLLAVLSDDARFLLLALSQGAVRLYDCSRTTVHDVTPPDVPTDIDAALNIDEHWQSLKLDTGAAGPAGLSQWAFHGQVGAGEERKADVLLFLQQIDRALRPTLASHEEPLVIAAVDYVFGLFRQVNSYGNLLTADWVRGNPDARRPEELRDDAWTLVRPRLQEQLREAAERYGALRARGRATGALREILCAGRDRRIAELFLAKDAVEWGRFDEETGALETAQGPDGETEDLFDVAAAYALRADAEVFAVAPQDVPGGSRAAATLRW